MNNILLAIGFKIVLTLPKKREVYHLKYQERTIEVLLDQIEGLEGDYFEAEIQVLEKEEIEEAKEVLIGLVQELGYSEADSIRLSYLELVLAESSE